ncbi:MAG TPA: DUF1707 domain-containing protein [Actinophytocola sp.]|uniref:DUF1707 SHOCT-like domain-containing protein n=1 Tax=Actinophytocola sp. TaxID=1872138 RepID=UPI002DDD1E44|nr:DUF1707 domain-containing protein [Actinophytocola sp.]HEV2781086.1 DUF1707 domain-containing protein [Actinophytocola sp.]
MSDLPAVPEPHELRASNADRERIAKILHDAMAEGRLTVTELEERLDKVYAAKTIGELQPLTRDLPVAQAPAPVAAQRAVAVPNDRIGGRGTSSAAVAIMSGTTRNGAWTVPPTFNAVAVMGGVDIDLTQARFEDRETTIQAFALMGGIDIVVPDDITVYVNGVGFMGAFEDSARVGEVAGAPVVKITGFAMMGGVEVKRPKKRKLGKSRPELES